MEQLEKIGDEKVNKKIIVAVALATHIPYSLCKKIFIFLGKKIWFHIIMP